MKKNKMMRLASVLLVLTLLSTSVISGTFAKYTTSDSASDTAKVAKWGVTALVSGSLFGENYYPNKTTDTADEIAAEAQQSVDAAANRGNIVAPGTKSDEGLKFAISGTPEVANTVKVEVVHQTGADKFKTIFLGEGTYATLVKAQGVTADNVTDYYVETTTGGVASYALAEENTFDENATYYELHDKVTISADGYYPITYTWTELDGTVATYTDKINGDTNSLFADISDYFTDYGKDGEGNPKTQNDPNVNIAKSGTLTWEWKYGDADKIGDTAADSDKADTILGNLMAEAADQIVVKKNADDSYAKPEATDYCLDIDFGVKITITQVN